MTQSLPAAQLLVCIKCQAQMPDSQQASDSQTPADQTRPGQVLFDELTKGAIPAGITVKAVECLSNCTRGCSVALRGAGRWTYVYGNFDPAGRNGAGADIVMDGAHRYQQTADGLVPWRQRSEHFRKNCIARIPPLDMPPLDTALEG